LGEEDRSGVLEPSRGHSGTAGHPTATRGARTDGDPSHRGSTETDR
jgi:hypothetical protein